MASIPDYEERAAEAGRFAETAQSAPMAQGWRDIATGYRMLAELVADAWAEPPDDRYVGFSA